VLVTWKYRPRDTFIQSLDPRARFIFLACIVLAITVVPIWDVRLLLPIFLLVLALYLMAHIPWRDTRRAWTIILVFVTIIVGLSVLTGRGGPQSLEQLEQTSPKLVEWTLLTFPGLNWSLTVIITVARAFFAIAQLLRMLTMALLAIPIAYTIDPGIYGVTFRRLGLSDRVAYLMDLAFRFVPTLGRDFTITVDAQRARGYEVESLKGGVFERLRRLAPLIVPVTMHSIVTGEEVIDAMDLRAFGARRRTWLRELHYRTRDYLFIGLGLAIFVAFMALFFLGYGDFWLPDWFVALVQ
jgi:energy-coupling factor transport system permease protein